MQLRCLCVTNRLLSESKGSLLDNIELLTTLQTSQSTSADIKKQLEESVITEIEIDTAREVTNLLILTHIAFPCDFELIK